jgi:hypothetical protein
MIDPSAVAFTVMRMLAGVGVGDDAASGVTQCHDRYVGCCIHSVMRMLAGAGVGDDPASGFTQCHDRSVCCLHSVVRMLVGAGATTITVDDDLAPSLG